MNMDTYDYKVPDYVRNASPDCFDTSVPGAVVVSGMRIDNPAAAWMAGAEIRKHASADTAATRLIKEACRLFNIDDSHYEELPVEGTITVSNGKHTANFNVFDVDTLNDAATKLLSKRASLPYEFAHDCAVELCEMAKKLKAEFNSTVVVPIRKLAGEYNADFAEGRQMLMEAADAAHERGLTEHEAVLKKLAGLCSDECLNEDAPYFVAALDQFYREIPDLRKKASSGSLENRFFLSTQEFIRKQANAPVEVAGTTVTAGKLKAQLDNLRKWAFVCGYNIPQNASTTEVCQIIQSMPKSLREEFVELFA